MNYQPPILEAGINFLPTAAKDINPVVISCCCWCLLSPLLTASCRSASNCFLQTSSSAHQRLTWPSYPRVEPACAKKAVTILIFLPDECLLYPTSVLPTTMEAEPQGLFLIPDECLLYPTSVLPTTMEAEPQGLFLIILIFTIFSMVGIGYYSPLHQSEAPALSPGEQSISEDLLLPLPLQPLMLLL